MKEKFADALTLGGKSNSLGRAGEVVDTVLGDKSRLGELYDCLFLEDAWVRMRAADALEKVCRVHPEWIESYIDRFEDELAISDQPSIQWHLAQIYGEVSLNEEQKTFAILWLKHLLSSTNVDWIVSANAMDTLVKLSSDGSVDKAETIKLLVVQKKHKSKSVVRRAEKLLSSLANSR